MKKPCRPKLRVQRQPPQGVGKRRPCPVLALVAVSDHRADVAPRSGEADGELGLIEEGGHGRNLLLGRAVGFAERLADKIRDLQVIEAGQLSEVHNKRLRESHVYFRVVGRSVH